MSLRLKRSGGALVRATLAVTLAAVMLALLPAEAEAQTEDKSTSSVVVRPGDSLWSISEERFGPNASPQQIANGVEKIYASNRERIGADPDLILEGQELLVPPAISERSAATTPVRKTAQAAETAGAGTRDRTARGTTVKATKTEPDRTSAKGGEASEPVSEREAQREAQREAERQSEPATLPDRVAAAPVPAVRAVAKNAEHPSSVASFLSTVRSAVASTASVLTAVPEFVADARNDERKLLGLGVLVLTLLVTSLVVWKLPMRRTTRRDAERWGMSSGYYGETTAAYRGTPFAYHPGSLGNTDEQDARGEAPRVPVRRAVLTGSVVHKANTANGRGRNFKARAKPRTVPRNGLALGAHNPKVRSAPRRVHATMRARKLRPRRGASRRPLRQGTIGRLGRKTP